MFIKRILTLAFSVALAACAIPTVAFASTTGRSSLYEHCCSIRAVMEALPCYTDADGDGICDWRETGNATCPGYTDDDGDGICDVCRNDAAHCPGYTDDDGDGICDNLESDRGGTGTYCGVGGHGCGSGCGHGHGRCC